MFTAWRVEKKEGFSRVYKMEQLPQYKTKVCRYGSMCHRLSKGTCTFAHSTDELRQYFNPWINAQYGVCVIRDHAIVEYDSFKQKWLAIQKFKERVQADDTSVVLNATCKDSCLFIQFSTHAIMLVGLPAQENTEVHTSLLEAAAAQHSTELVPVTALLTEASSEAAALESPSESSQS